jgi:uncharacterized protein
MTITPTVLITGASSGIGAVYADRFAQRGHDLVLVARDRSRMEKLADRLRRETGVTIEVLQADLTDAGDLALVEARLRDDSRIGILVNNAGMSAAGGFLDQSAGDVTKVVNLNATAVLRLAHAAAQRFAKAGEGAIINISSVAAFMAEWGSTVYGATKAFVLFLSQSLQFELASHGVYVQAVLPAATRTEIWERSGKDVNKLPAVMETEELVDAALSGFDRREPITFPSLPDLDQWTDLDNARKAMIPNLNQVHAAERYRRLSKQIA